MPTAESLRAFISQHCPQIHATRLDALWEVVQSATSGAPVALTSLARGLPGRAYAKHKIKRVDRLLGNAHLHAERETIYTAFARHLLRGQTRPVILIDWSDLTPDRRSQLLRAVIPAQGRSLTLYEEVHPLARLASPVVQQRFLRRLSQIVPAHCTPIIVTDAGFRAPWFRQVQALGWQFVGRVRNRDFVRPDAHSEWFPCKRLYTGASPRARALGAFEVVRSRPFSCALWLVRQPRPHRVPRTCLGVPDRSKRSLKFAAREREPWLIAGSLALTEEVATQVVAWYRLRMQIEEGLRDTKSVRYGFGLTQSLTRQPPRLAILLLIAALAAIACWQIGIDTIARAEHYRWQANTRQAQRVLSVITLGRLILQAASHRSPSG